MCLIQFLQIIIIIKVIIYYQSSIMQQQAQHQEDAICIPPAPAGHAYSIKTPKPGDNDAMRLWRATVSPIDNIGEPYNAQWWGLEDRPPPT
jgi:hypothetical protein